MAKENHRLGGRLSLHGPVGYLISILICLLSSRFITKLERILVKHTVYNLRKHQRTQVGLLCMDTIMHALVHFADEHLYMKNVIQMDKF